MSWRKNFTKIFTYRRGGDVCRIILLKNSSFASLFQNNFKQTNKIVYISKTVDNYSSSFQFCWQNEFRLEEETQLNNVDVLKLIKSYHWVCYKQSDNVFFSKRKFCIMAFILRSFNFFKPLNHRLLKPKKFQTLDWSNIDIENW